jgi:sigma-B regulation protein RsbU (phosphoserine phosphatase)
MALGPRADGGRPGAAATAAAALLGELLHLEREATLIAGELSTRYEEIDLLYTISDILGRTVALDEAAKRIAREVSDVVGARRASIMVHDEGAQVLRVVGGRGLELYQVTPVRVDDPVSIAARVFRNQAPLGADATSPGVYPGVGGAERGYRGMSFLTVPITYAPPGGEPRPVGVINLTDRIGEDSFTAGHRKLIAAIANQVGAAIENARLVEVERQRARQNAELALAHDLQLALLPSPGILAKRGDVAARAETAESLGGDFFDLISLRRDAVGVTIGDVAGHGVAAALLMAHVVSALGILAQSSATPQETMERLLEAIGDELRRAETHLSLFYGVVDRRRGMLQYANAGHPHAFVLPAEGGAAVRLSATAPPLGLGTDIRIGGAEVPWRHRRDVLCLFTDGLSESRNAAGIPYGEERLLAVVRRHQHGMRAERIVAAVFEDIESFGAASVHDDRTLLILRR